MNISNPKPKKAKLFKERKHQTDRDVEKHRPLGIGNSVKKIAKSDGRLFVGLLGSEIGKTSYDQDSPFEPLNKAKRIILGQLRI